MPENDLQAVAFPRLDDGQMAALERCGGAALRQYRAGQKLIEVGERDFKFFVVKSGEIEIVDESGDTPGSSRRIGAESSPATWRT